MPALQILAGATALQQIEQHGFQQSLFTQLFAASGGPKWLSLARLDQYLFSEFFAEREDPIYTMGASSGAWRLACFAQQDPHAAYERLIEHYVHQSYEAPPSRAEVSGQVINILNAVLGEQQGADILANPIVRSHFVVNRARGLNKINAKVGLALGLGLTALTNAISRSSLDMHYQRVVVSHQDHASPFGRLTDLPTQQAKFAPENLKQVLTATGSIPLVLNSVDDIPGLPKGKYYDGGITDYHFDMPMPTSTGLSLFPHFFPSISPGWFDKSLKWRKAKANLHNAVILAPTDEFVSKLSERKIPDRDDFSKLDTQTRIKFWLESVEASQQIVDELKELIASGRILSRIQGV
ncbi:alpha/beta hydrolase [Shewanella maritima]|uniref:Alpha/beta hydrolase n=1 Tax=Shewanella maritima TaxID=2520507 RepID=A0A411PGM5_9GAMM|nr:alpha/beta hydrolase [Shewanella maritima]QBF82648.1 alpha/beta hydrolase [Shewanella maritima]